MVVGVEAVVPVVAGAAAFTSDTEFILDNNGRTAAGEECNLASTDIERMIVAEPLLPPEAETTGGCAVLLGGEGRSDNVEIVL